MSPMLFVAIPTTGWFSPPHPRKMSPSLVVAVRKRTAWALAGLPDLSADENSCAAGASLFDAPKALEMTPRRSKSGAAGV